MVAQSAFTASFMVLKSEPVEMFAAAFPGCDAADDGVDLAVGDHLLGVEGALSRRSCLTPRHQGIV